MRNGFTVEELTRPARWEAHVSSMRGREVLATRIPVLDGRVSIDGEGQVPERADLSFTPEYKPVSPFSPLAAYGQELFLTITVTIGGRSVDYEIGAFLIDSWEEQTDGTIKVTGVGLLQRVADDPAALPSSPVPGSTLRVEASRLAHPVPVMLDHGVEDVSLPRGLAWGTDRLDALADLIASHGLRGAVRNDRQLHLMRTVTGAAATISNIIVCRWGMGALGASTDLNSRMAWLQAGLDGPMYDATVENLTHSWQMLGLISVVCLVAAWLVLQIAFDKKKA